MKLNYCKYIDNKGFDYSVKRSEPTIVTEQFKHWPAMKKWSLDFFRTNYSDTQVNFDRQTSTIGCVIDRIRSGDSVYLNQVQLKGSLLSLLDDISPMPDYLAECKSKSKLIPKNYYYPDGICELFIGGSGGGFSKLHYDLFHSHVMIVQISGEKQFRLYRPEESKYLYVNKEHQHLSQIDNPFSPCLKTYPDTTKAKAYDITVKPGEAVFLPCGWWHATKFDEPTIAIAVNVINKSNWSNFKKDYLISAKKVSFLNGVDKWVRLALYDLLNFFGMSSR